MPTLITLLIPMIKYLVPGVEELFAKLKSKTGEQKLQAVLKSLETLWTEMENAGIIPKGTPAPSSDTLLGAIESALAEAKSNGTITTGSGVKNSSPAYTIQGTISLPSTAKAG